MQRPLAIMMNRTMRTVQQEATLLEAAALMRETRVGALLVEADGRLIGIVSAGVWWHQQPRKMPRGRL